VLPRQTLLEGRALRDLGEQKWQGTKGSQDFHRSFLTILNYLVRQDNPGIKLFYESGTRRVEHAKRPVIVPNDTLARGPRTRLDALDIWMEQLQGHYGTPETYSPDQSQRIVNWVATIITRDPVMSRMLIES